MKIQIYNTDIEITIVEREQRFPNDLDMVESFKHIKLKQSCGVMYL